MSPPSSSHFTTSSIARLALLLTLALGLHQIERMLPLPILPYPGVKLGLGNLVTLASLFLLTPLQTLLFVVLRSLLNASFGGFSGFLFSFTGALAAFVLMAGLAYAMPKHFSLIGLSIGGATAHNLGQLFVAALLAGNFGIVLYLPILLGTGALSGLAVGLMAQLLLKALASTKRYPLNERLLPLL